MRELWNLFQSFVLIGSLTFGGGYAMLPMLTKEIVEKHKWATEEELLDYFAIGQCTPGVIAVNTATIIGYRRKGVIGAAFATLGVVLPSLLLITLIAAFLKNFMDIVWIAHAFAGIRIAVCALIAATVWKLIRTNLTSGLKIGIAIVSFVTVALLQLSPLYVTVAFAVLGAVYYGRKEKA